MCECLVHLTKTAGIPGRAASDPIGVCKECGGLACNEHGARDPNVPEFVCVLCDPKLLTVSATRGADEESGDDDSGPGHPSGGTPAARARLFVSVEDFLSRRPYDADWLAAGIGGVEQFRERAAARTRNRPERTEMLMAAMALTELLEIPREQQDAELRSILPRRVV